MTKDAPKEHAGRAGLGTTHRRGGRARAVGAYVPRIVRAAFEKQGFPSADILNHWPVIAGDDLAAFTAPERLIWPRRTRRSDDRDAVPQPARGKQPHGATLVLRVDGPRAIEVQHAAPQILDRLNGYLGYRAVTVLRIVQGPVRRTGAARRIGPRKPTVEPASDSGTVQRIKVEALRAALNRLGAQLRR